MGDPYATDAEFYDLVHGRGGDDIDFWLALAAETGGPVLEVGTGTGRIAVALAGAHDVTGLDPSVAMLEHAREAATAEAVTVRFLRGTLTSAELPEAHFALVIVPANVFLYYAAEGEQEAALGAARRCLREGGLVAIDLPGPAMGLAPEANGQPLRVFHGETQDGELLDAWHVHEDDLAEQRRTLTVTYEITGRDGSVRRRRSEHMLRYPYRYEVEYLLRLSGLRVGDVYGDYELGPFGGDSERMIVMARKDER